MAKFGESIPASNQPSNEDIARIALEEQQLKYQEQRNDPINIRYREVLGMIATRLMEANIPVEPHRLRVARGKVRGPLFSTVRGWEASEKPGEVDAIGWYLTLSPKFKRENQSLLLPTDQHSTFVCKDRQAADDSSSNIIVPINHQEVSDFEMNTIENGRARIIEHNNTLYLTYSGLHDILNINNLSPSLAMRDVPSYELVDGEILRHSLGGYDLNEVYSDSFEENLTRLFMSKLDEHR